MKRIQTVVEVDNDGLQKLLGEYVQLWCLNYIYAGKLVGVNDHDVVLESAGVVYETGNLSADKFKDFQPHPHAELFIRTACIESYCLAPQLAK